MGARSNYSIKNKLFTLNITNHFLMQICLSFDTKSRENQLIRDLTAVTTFYAQHLIDSFFFSNNGLIFKHN